LSQGNTSFRPAIAFYFDLTFDQPNDYVFEDASVSLTFSSETADVSITEYYGPHQLEGDSREQHFNRIRQLMPDISAPLPGGPLNISGMGETTTTDFVRDWHWEFYGMRRARGSGPRPYDTITWKWLGKNLDKTQRIPRQAMKCAVIVYHNDRPFGLSLQIDGKLRSLTHRLAHYCTRSPKNQEPWSIKPSEFQAALPPHDLETIKDTLHTEMLRANTDDFLKCFQVSPTPQTTQSAAPTATSTATPTVPVTVLTTPATAVDISGVVQSVGSFIQAVQGGGGGAGTS